MVGQGAAAIAANIAPRCRALLFVPPVAGSPACTSLGIDCSFTLAEPDTSRLERCCLSLLSLGPLLALLLGSIVRSRWRNQTQVDSVFPPTLLRKSLLHHEWRDLEAKITTKPSPHLGWGVRAGGHSVPGNLFLLRPRTSSPSMFNQIQNSAPGKAMVREASTSTP
ncbi:uncharacterized protein RAG0_11458 [Rhynchosporium agropyri]|uniref:Uncharacterized protein n=1 Tax=Rhynchosporium agropyri TaxID=914238 RepID=A0A1E1L4B2_9HELO|nr:uncharacterized protein RAG0_11458 [Rhynchosporium agropyri]